MLKKINKIKFIRNLLDLHSDIEFKKNNVIYALNGSGKTSLSRFFNIFIDGVIDKGKLEELKSLEAENKNIEFIIELDEHIINENDDSIPEGARFFVYNNDFLKDNIQVNDFTTNKDYIGNLIVATVDKKQIEVNEIKEDIRKISNEREETENILKSDIEKIINALQNKYGGKRNTFSNIVNFENLNNDFIKKNNIIENKNAENDYLKLINLNEENRLDFHFISLNPPELNKVKNIIGTSYIFEDIEKEFKKHIKLIGRDWIEEGLNYQNNNATSKCPFCQQETKNLKIIEKYRDLISSEKNLLLKKIELLIADLKKLYEDISENNKIYETNENLIKEYKSILNINQRICKIDKKLNSNIKKIIEFLETKRSNLKAVYSNDRSCIDNFVEELTEQIKEALKIVNNNNQVIQKINDKIFKTGQLKTKLRKRIAKNKLLELSDCENIKKLNRNINTYKQKKKESEEKTKLLPVTKKRDAIKALMNYIFKVIGVNNFLIGDNFNLMLRASKGNFDVSQKTDLISDGERTIVSFVYFLAHVLEKIDSVEKLGNAIFVIDDPISSLSYDYMHKISLLIKNLNKLYKHIFKAQNNIVGPQLLILTHNLQFYNLLIKNVFKNKRDKIFLELLSINPENQVFRKLKDEKLSSYIASLMRIYRFINNENVNISGNDIRIVLETICSFHMVDFCEESLCKIFNLQSINASLCIVSNDLSHSDFERNIDLMSSASLLRSAANELLELIKNTYRDQYGFIERSCKS